MLLNYYRDAAVASRETLPKTHDCQSQNNIPKGKETSASLVFWTQVSVVSVAIIHPLQGNVEPLWMGVSVLARHHLHRSASTNYLPVIINDTCFDFLIFPAFASTYWASLTIVYLLGKILYIKFIISPLFWEHSLTRILSVMSLYVRSGESRPLYLYTANS